MVVRDGGMVQTADYAGRVFSAGINWLEKKFGPLIPIDENVERSLRYAHRRNHPELAHPKCMIDKRDE
jgi:hypothetical protein